MYTITSPSADATLAEATAERLRVALLAGAFDGVSLTEASISARFDISRTPVRAALQTLAQEGLLEYTPQRGFKVRRHDPELVAEAYEVRAVLEGLAARRVAEAGLEKGVEQQLASIVAEGAALLAADGFDAARWRTMNARFHNAIIVAAGNDLLRATAKMAEGVPLAALTVIADLAPTPDRLLLQQAQTDHAVIVTAMRAGQGARAEARMREHIHVAGELVAATLAKRTPT